MERPTLHPGMRITVRDVLEYLVGGMTVDELLTDFPELTAKDIRAYLAYAADQLPRPTARGSCKSVALLQGPGPHSGPYIRCQTASGWPPHRSSPNARSSAAISASHFVTFRFTHMLL